MPKFGSGFGREFEMAQPGRGFETPQPGRGFETPQSGRGFETPQFGRGFGRGFGFGRGDRRYDERPRLSEKEKLEKHIAFLEEELKNAKNELKKLQ